MELIEEKTYTTAEYFEFEKTSGVKHEYYFGKLIEMPGESKRANKLGGNFFVALKSIVKGKVFEVYSHDVRLNVLAEKIYRYPDIVVAPAADDEDDYAVLYPILIVEVLSPSNEKNDTIKKRKEYSSMPSLQYYLIVHQEEMLIELDQRNGTKWEFQYFDKPEEIIKLPYFQGEISMAAIYEGIKFRDLGEVQ